MHNTLILANSAAPITITIRANTGGAAGWKEGSFLGAAGGYWAGLLGAGGARHAYPPESFEAKSRAIGCIFSATCTAPDADAWTAAGDLMRGASNPDLQCMVLPDRSALIGTNIATGTGKGSMVLPYGIVLSPVAQRGIYASLSRPSPAAPRSQWT
ncbi:hypothetical protein SNK04_014317 [Fusarium graminearum]